MMNKKLVAVFIESTRSFYNALMNDFLAFYLEKESLSMSLFYLFGRKLSIADIDKCIDMGITKFISFLEPEDDVLKHIDNLKDAKMIVLGRDINSKNVFSICTDDFKGGQIAATYLLEQGYKKFAYVSVPTAECSFRRYNGFEDVLKKNGIKNISILNACDISRLLIEEKIQNNMGIFFFSDQILFDFDVLVKMTGIKRKNLSLVGYDGIGKYYGSLPQYSSIYYSFNEIAEKTAKMISGSEEAENVVFDVTLNRIG